MQIKNFSGIVPRTPDQNLPPNAAQKAQDVDLSRGTIRPWRERQAVYSSTDTAQTFYVYGCCAYSWDECVTVAEWLPSCPRLYITGRKPYPEVATLGEDCTLSYSRLGVPMPAYAPVVSFITVPDKSRDSELRAYVVTYVNHLGEESAPSFPSTDLAVDDGDPVTVSGWGTPLPEFNVTRVRIYRRASGYKQGTEKEQELETNWFLVGDIPITQTTFVDRLKNMDVGSAIATREYRPAPEGLQQITAVTGTAILCGFVNNVVYFSRNHQPWNWPLELEVTLDDNIVHIQEDNGKLYVSTTGRPYTIDATVDCGDRPYRGVVMADYPYPDVACANPRGSTITPFGMVYPSTDGLVILSDNNPPAIITKELFSKNEWREIRPESIRLAYYKGNIVCVTDNVTLMILIDNNNYMTAGAMTTLSDMPVDMHLTSNGELLMLESGQIFQWDAAPQYRPYIWRSVEIINQINIWFTAARVDVRGTISFDYTAGIRQTFSRSVSGDKAFRLPRFGRHREFSVTISGTEEVYAIDLTVSKQEIAS